MYALDNLKIPLTTVNLQQLYVGWAIIFIPILYQKVFIHRDFVWMFFISQVTYVLAESLNCVLVLRWNQEIGIPNIVLYLLGGSVASILERGFSFFPSFILISKMVPVGVESSMMSLSVTIILMNQFFLRSVVGLAINGAFIHVTKQNMDNYLYLKIICAVSALLPFSYMFNLIPSLK